MSIAFPWAHDSASRHAADPYATLRAVQAAFDDRLREALRDQRLTDYYEAVERACDAYADGKATLEHVRAVVDAWRGPFPEARPERRDPGWWHNDRG